MKLSESVHRKDNSKKTHFKTNTLLALLRTKMLYESSIQLLLLTTFHEAIKSFYEFNILCNSYYYSLNF